MARKASKRKTRNPEAIAYGEFNRLLKDNPPQHPQNDSPGDSGEDELREATLGKDYPEEFAEAIDSEEDIPADTPSYPLAERDLNDTEESIGDPYGLRSSPRPNPEFDIEKESDTH